MARKTVIRHKDIAVAVAVAVLNIAAIVLVQILVIMPPRSLARSQEREFVKNAKDLEENGKKERSVRNLEAENVGLRSQLALFDKRVPVKSEVAALFAEVLGLADRNELKILYTQPKDPVPLGQGFQRTPYELEILGQYHVIGQFLSRIESHDSFMQVAKVDLSGSTDGAVRAKVLLHLYSTTLEPAVPETPAPEPADKTGTPGTPGTPAQP